MIVIVFEYKSRINRFIKSFLLYEIKENPCFLFYAKLGPNEKIINVGLSLHHFVSIHGEKEKILLQRMENCR